MCKAPRIGSCDVRDVQHVEEFDTAHAHVGPLSSIDTEDVAPIQDALECDQTSHPTRDDEMSDGSSSEEEESSSEESSGEDNAHLNLGRGKLDEGDGAGSCLPAATCRQAPAAVLTKTLSELMASIGAHHVKQKAPPLKSAMVRLSVERIFKHCFCVCAIYHTALPSAVLLFGG